MSDGPRTLARLHPPVVVTLVVGLLAAPLVFGIESWPLTAYPMYSFPKDVSQVGAARIALELVPGEVVFWNPSVPYLARDLGNAIERSLAAPELEAKLERGARLVLADLAHEGPDPSRVRQVRVVLRTVHRADDARHWFVGERTLASFDVRDLR